MVARRRAVYCPRCPFHLEGSTTRAPRCRASRHLRLPLPGQRGIPPARLRAAGSAVRRPQNAYSLLEVKKILSHLLVRREIGDRRILAFIDFKPNLFGG